MSIFSNRPQMGASQTVIPPAPPPLANQPSFGTSLLNKPQARSSFGSTVLTSDQSNFTPANTAKKSLLGQ